MKRTTRQAKRFMKKKNKKLAAKKVADNKAKRKPPKWPNGPTNRTSYPR